MNNAVNFQSSEGSIDIMKFTQAFWGMGCGTCQGVPPLSPVMNFVLKVTNSVPLDASFPVISVGYPGEEQISLTETEYLNYLFEHGRISTKDYLGKDFKRVVLAIGNRGRKSTIVAANMLYDLFRIMQFDVPQIKLGLLKEDVLIFGVNSLNVENANLLFDTIRGYAERSPYFRSLLHKEYKNKMLYLSTNNLRNKDGRHSFSLVKGSSFRGCLGPTLYSGVLDCAAYLPARKFQDYIAAITPTALGRFIVASSPSPDNNGFVDVYEDSFTDQKALSISIPSWETNPDIPVAFLHAQKSNNPDFDFVYGAKIGRVV